MVLQPLLTSQSLAKLLLTTHSLSQLVHLLQPKAISHLQPVLPPNFQHPLSLELPKAAQLLAPNQLLLSYIQQATQLQRLKQLPQLFLAEL